MMELTENKKEKGIWKLPKNVRQIGEPGSSTRILIEDYAYTYLHQMAEQNLTCMKTAVLLGNAEDGRICIQAAVEADMGQDQKKWFNLIITKLLYTGYIHQWLCVMILVICS